MTKKGPDGNKISGPEPAASKTALLIMDMISDYEFADGDKLYKKALKAARQLKRLKERARKEGVPIIYVNDNFGQWTDDFRSFVDSVSENSAKGKKIVELIRPEEGDYHILKPQRSAFYETPLGILLVTLDISCLIITGITTDICILFTAHDAYMRGFEIEVPSDCTAAVEDSFHEDALEFLSRVTNTKVRPAKEIEF